MLLSGFRQMRSAFEHPSWANRHWLRRIFLPPEGPTLCRSEFSWVVPWVPYCQRAMVVLIQERDKKAHASWECKIISFGCRTTCVNSWACEVNCRWEFGIVPSFQWRKALNRINIYWINWFFLSPYFFYLHKQLHCSNTYALLSVAKGWSQPNFGLKSNLSCFQELSAAVPSMSV